MKAKDAFEQQIQAKPASDTFTVFAKDSAVEYGLLKFAVDINDVDDFYTRIDAEYVCEDFLKEGSAIPVLARK